MVGAPSPKGQEREDQYFGDISERMGNAIYDAEMELFRLGVPMNCRHREVAPGCNFVTVSYTQQGNTKLHRSMSLQ